jgi:pimeloyl-ACP methyl ester carboxylesterase
MARALQAEGNEGRNRVQLQLLENEQMTEASAALARLRARTDVDSRRVGVVGHSFGGSLSLMAARDPGIRAAVIFGGAAGSWNESPVLRERLLAAEMQRLAKPHALKIYPPFGADNRAGHNLVFRSVPTWEADVFAFLDEHLRR